MKTTPWIALLALLISATLAFGAGSHDERVEKAKTDMMAKRDNALQSLAELEVSLKAHGVESKEIAAPRKTLGEMMKTRAWRDLASRTTKTREAAKATLEQYLKTTNEQLVLPRNQLALIKKAEFEAWARANPEAAKLLEIERRVEAAESAAMNAQSQAEQAESAAAQAQAAAQQAQWQAQEAERRARNAQQKSQRAEDALWEHGIHSW